jgi:D-lactate dehydrogenase
MKTLVYSSRPYDQPLLEKAAYKRHQMIFTNEKLNEETAALADGFDAVSLFTSDDASQPVLERLSQGGVKYIALRSVGYDHVDLIKADQLGIRVANVPAYSPYSVAEHAVAMLLCMNRKIIQSQILIELQDFRIETLMGFDLHGKTVGVIGTGKIGLAFCNIMKGFGCKVLASDPVMNAEAGLGIEYVSLARLLYESDIISVHCPLNDDTRHLISEEEFALMKRSAILVNTSRGAVVDTKSLINALAEGRIGGACLDVYEKEKGIFFEDHRKAILRDEDLIRLMSFQNVLITCHQGFLTEEAIDGIVNTTILNMDSWGAGKNSPNELHVKKQSLLC